MPFGPTTDKHVQNPGVSRDDLTEAAREPQEDHAGAGWGAWGRDQVAQDDDDKSLMEVLDVAGDNQRSAERGAATSVPPRDVPSPLLNPTAHDIRKDTHDTDEVRMASEPPQHEQ